MKYIIYTIYAATVLLFSGFAKAQSVMPVENNQNPRSSVTIQEVLIDSQTLDLNVSGYVPNPCYQMPYAIMTIDHNKPQTLVVRLFSPAPTQFCIQRIQEYSTVVSLKQLAKSSQLPLEDAVVYTVRTEGHDFAIEVFGRDLKQ